MYYSTIVKYFAIRSPDNGLVLCFKAKIPHIYHLQDPMPMLVDYKGICHFFLIKKKIMDIYVNSLLLITSIKSNTKELYHSTCFVVKKFQ